LNLIIDIGNTRVKAALVESNEIKHFFVFKTTDELLAADIITKHAVTSCIIGTVVNGLDVFIDQLKSKTKTLLFTDKTPIPIKNLYKSAHTLGSDRLAAAVAGNFLFPNQNTLVIDAGTCIKYNFVNTANEYVGGAISPGLQMRFKAMNTFTARLPLLEPDESFDMLVGTNTNESILSGVQIGIIAEMEGFISRYREQYPDVNIVLTGGDANFFEKRLKKPIFADSFLIMKGLNTILEYNKK
jgi:type III pantothenate kinase